MLIWVLKYQLNLGASEASASWTPNRGFAFGLQPFRASQHAVASRSNIESHRKFLHHYLCSQTAKKILGPDLHTSFRRHSFVLVEHPGQMHVDVMFN